ncbi:MAG TPA: hypothetical protein VFS08_10240 [Gemmatimonadaceae bacterium]|nr:hypothetical protein [Gemmatimonadaceae bacterium]
MIRSIRHRPSCASGRRVSHGARRGVMRLVACLLALAGPAVGRATAQRPGTPPAGAVPQVDSIGTTPLPQPPISPKRALLTSLALPGYGQARLQRPVASALFYSVEAVSVVMLAKSLHDLRVAKRFRTDSIPAEFKIDPTTGEVQRDESGAPLVDRWEPGFFTGERIRARRLHVEDWVAVLVFNHLIAGADAFVAAHLWDVPAAVSVSGSPRGAAMRIAVPW